MKIYGGMSVEELGKVIDEIFASNQSAIADYATTHDKVVNFFMGQTMKRTAGMADSVVAKEIIVKRLSK
jgi:aspartyl-tRNA(Asn)/glutamyl-tRNA(Gln) amidotransferase subunit B